MSRVEQIKAEIDALTWKERCELNALLQNWPEDDWDRQMTSEGKFDRLEGAGKPLNLEPMPAEENARLTWWALRILRQNDVVPDEVRLRKQIDVLRDQMAAATTDARLVHLVAEANALVFKLNTLGTNAIGGNLAPISLEVEREKLRVRTVI